jgi:hypothetical protein
VKTMKYWIDSTRCPERAKIPRWTPTRSQATTETTVTTEACRTPCPGNQKLEIDTLARTAFLYWAIDSEMASRVPVSMGYKAPPLREDLLVFEDDGEREEECGEALVLVFEVSTYFALGLVVLRLRLIVLGVGVRDIGNDGDVHRSLRWNASLGRIVANRKGDEFEWAMVLEVED